jgi:general secretion pathway protein H
MTSRPKRVPARPSSAAGMRGFTLIELLVVLAVIGFVLALFVGYRAPWSNGLGLEATARELAAELRLARSEAIADNRAVALALDLPRKRYQVDGEAARPLPPRIAVGLLTIDGERQSATVGDIRFNPDGSSTGGRIILAESGRKVAVGVDWLTGRVTVADVQ